VSDAPADRSLLPASVWERHKNPKSGWSRVAVWPLLLYAAYHRDGRLLVLALAWTVVNPVVFPPPESDEAWMTRVVVAERWWTERRDAGLFDLTYPNVLNVGNGLASTYALWAAARQHPRRTAVAGAAAMSLKLWFVGALVRRYERRDEAAPFGGSGD